MHRQLIQGVIALSLVQPTLSHAAGFALSEQSGSGLGNAFAGAAAVAEDTSTIFFNPAGMTYIQGTQFAGAIHAIKPTARFNDDGSVKATFSGAAGGDGGDLGDWALIPNLYYKTDINDSLKLGLGINAPFGLKTEYDKDWIGRFQGVKSELKTININPSLALKLNDKLSLGAGISAMWSEAILTSAVNLALIGQPESTAKSKGSDWGFGFNLGAIYELDNTRIGIAYRSRVIQHLQGKSTSPSTALNGTPSATLNTDITADLTLPETLSISTFSQLNSQWDILTDITWTRWSRFKDLTIMRDNGSNSVLSSTDEQWSNTMRYSLAVNYKYTDAVKLRAGVAYDEEAISNDYRTVRIPGNDRIWLSLGASYQYSPVTKLDVGYAHLFVKDAKIDENQNTLASRFKGNIQGEYHGHVDILSVQLTHNF